MLSILLTKFSRKHTRNITPPAPLAPLFPLFICHRFPLGILSHQNRNQTNSFKRLIDRYSDSSLKINRAYIMLSALYRLTQRMGVSMAAAPGINDHDDDASIDSLSSVPSEASQEDGSQDEEDKESALSPNQPENTNAPSLHSRTVKDEPSETFPGFHIRDIRRLNSPHIDHIYYRPEHPEIIVRSTPGVQRIIDTMQSMKMEYREACDYLVDLGFKSYFKGVAWSKEKKMGENRKQLSRAEGEGQQTQSLQDLGEGPSSRKSSRFTSVETAAALDSASPSSEVKSSPVKSSDVKPPRKKTPQQNTKSNSQSVSTNKSSSTTNKPSPNYSDATLHSAHWTRGPHTHDRKSRRWISPTHKISFRYRKDAELFEGMRRKCGGDEVEAWSEVGLESIAFVVILFCMLE